MPRISGVDLPPNKRMDVALRYIYGIGPAIARRVLTKTGVNPSTRAKDLSEADTAKIRQEIESLVQLGTEQVPPGRLPLTPRSQQVIKFAQEEAVAVNQNSVDVEHLLLALLREPDGVAESIGEHTA